MAFQFRLQKVLNHRQRLVDQQSRKVSEAARQVALVESKIKAIKDDVQHIIQSGNNSSVNVEVADLNQRRVWLDHLSRKLDSLAQVKDQADQELSLQRDELTKVWRDLEVLKKLKAKQKEDWKHEILRRENQDLDEIGQIRADRAAREKVSHDQA